MKYTFTFFLFIVASFCAAQEQDNSFLSMNFVVSYTTSPETLHLPEARGMLPEKILQEAEDGDMFYQYLAACGYESGGNGFSQDLAEAAKWYEASAAQGFHYAIYRLANWYENGEAGLAKDREKAAKYWRMLAEAGDADAQIRLAKFYEKKADEPETLRWLKMAAVRGKTDAITLLREKRMLAKTIPAAEAGDAAAQYELGKYYRRKQRTLGGFPMINFSLGPFQIRQDSLPEPEWMKQMRLSAEQGYAPAQYEMGVARMGLYFGVPGDGEDAVRYFRLAAEQGHAEAMLCLALCYVQGKGVKRDDAEAARFLQASAEKGNAQAMRLLAYAYAQGIGVERDDEKAAEMFAAYAAAAKIRMPERRIRGTLFSWSDDSDEQDAGEKMPLGDVLFLLAEGFLKAGYDEDAVKWFRKAADAGSSAAKGELGKLYLLGRGVERDETHAMKLLHEGSEGGDKIAASLYACGIYAGWGGETPDKSRAIGIIPRESFTAFSPEEESEFVILTCLFACAAAREDGAGIYRWVREMEKLAAEKDTEYEIMETRTFISQILAACHAAGWGVPRDEEKAVSMYREALARNREFWEMSGPEESDADIYTGIASTLEELGAEKEVKAWRKKAVKAGGDASFFLMSWGTADASDVSDASEEASPENLLRSVWWHVSGEEVEFDFPKTAKLGIAEF